MAVIKLFAKNSQQHIGTLKLKDSVTLYDSFNFICIISNL